MCQADLKVRLYGAGGPRRMYVEADLEVGLLA
jgi:hypothetical protein